MAELIIFRRALGRKSATAPCIAQTALPKLITGHSFSGSDRCRSVGAGNLSKRDSWRAFRALDRRSAISLFVLLTSLSACTEMPGTATSDRIYVGVVRVVTPRTEGDLTAYKTQLLGATIGDEAAIGWQSREVVSAAPDKCQLVIIIRSDVAAANARDVLSRIGDKKPCVADFSSK